jgi:hypothetical protein
MKVEVKNPVSNTSTKQKIQLVDGVFTVSEANDIIQNLINEKINFHKLQRLTLCEGFTGSNTKYPDDRITQLENDKLISKDFFKNKYDKKVTIKINGVLEISINE